MRNFKRVDLPLGSHKLDSYDTSFLPFRIEAIFGESAAAWVSIGQWRWIKEGGPSQIFCQVSVKLQRFVMSNW